MKVKTSELTDHALDWAVANCEGVSLEHGLTDDERYSTDWAQGGPIIEREGILVQMHKRDGSIWRSMLSYPSQAPNGEFMKYFHQDGPTPLVAAMRCFVASKLGDEVDVPEELMA